MRHTRLTLLAGHVRERLGSRFVRNLASMGGAQLATRISRLLSTVIIARTLSAGDFGLAAVVLTVYELVAVFTRNGIAARVVQARQDEVQRVARTAHWLTWIICVGLLLVQALVALPFAHAYGTPSLALPIALMGLIYLATPLSIMQTVFMEREGRVGRIAFAGAAQMIADNVLTVIFALAGLGMWAIVLPKLLVAPIWVVVNRTGHAWRAPPGFTLAGSREILTFSRHVLGSEMLTTLQANIDNLLVGYFLGVQALGVYYFAYNAGLGITLGLVTSFAVAVYPHLCEVRSDPAALAARYRESLRMVGLIIVPMIVVQVALAPLYVPIVFSAKWVPAIPVLMLICASALPRPFAVVVSQLLRAAGRPDIEFRWQQVLTVALVAALIVSVQFGVAWVAVTVLLVHCTVLPLYVLYAPRILQPGSSPRPQISLMNI